MNTSQPPAAMPFQLSRSAAGNVSLAWADGTVVEDVRPVRAFPISGPDAGISLVDARGHEAAWIERLDDLSAHNRAIIDEALAAREFLPEIRQLLGVSRHVAPSTWTVDTDRGRTTLMLGREEDICRMGPGMLLIADCHGVHYLVRDRRALDATSRRLLERFL